MPKVVSESGATWPASLRTRRKLAHMTQQQLAAASGVAQTRISELERGLWGTAATRRKVAEDGLGLDADEVFPGGSRS